ncbi:MAG: BamA/TamA family outer membrane protein [Acidobacteriota bacterium]|nr:BamA/TamA family outer membrane protein [Acidobacteriota bacterium]
MKRINGSGRIIAGLMVCLALTVSPLLSLPPGDGDMGGAGHRAGGETPADIPRTGDPKGETAAAEDGQPAKKPVVDRDAPALLRLGPILFYDTDAGLGYGGRIFLRSALRFTESFDLLVYHTDKGDRRIRFAASWPDAELRRGKTYPFAFDLLYDFEKTAETAFFGVGGGSKFEDREFYVREPSEISAVFSHGLSARTHVRFGWRYRSVVNSEFSPDSHLAVRPPASNASKAAWPSYFVGFVYDSRNSVIHPSGGIFANVEIDRAPGLEGESISFVKLGARFRYFKVLLQPRTILAVRIWGQTLFGTNLPVQTLLTLGGRDTLRGSARFRFLDQTFLLLNTELRIPVYRRIGAILGLDAGRVWASPGKIDGRGWTVNPVFGLRFIADDFVVRADVGLGRDGTGLYLTAGHMF